MFVSLYGITLIFLLLILKPHPASLFFVFFVNILTGFTPIITLFINYDLVSFERYHVIFLLMVFNVSILFFSIFFLFFKQRKMDFYVLREYEYSRFVLYFLSISAVVVIYQNIGQGVEVITHGYIAGYKSASENNDIIKATSLFPFLLVFYFFLFTSYLNSGKKSYIFIMLAILISYSIYGSRSFFIYSFISIIVFLIVLNKITYKRCAIIFSILLPLILFAGAIREGGNAEKSTLIYRMALELANIPMIISNLNVLDNLHQSFISILLIALPQSITVPLGIIPVNSLATEFVMHYDPGWAEAGGGFGFTIIGEIYYRFGIMGLTFIPYIIVFFLNNLEIKFLRGDDFDKSLILTCYYGIFMWGRGDFIEISRLIFIVLFLFYIKRLVIRGGR